MPLVARHLIGEGSMAEGYWQVPEQHDPRMAGHVSLKTTNIYAQVDLEMKTRAMEICQVPETFTAPSPSRNAGFMAFLDALRVKKYYVA